MVRSPADAPAVLLEREREIARLEAALRAVGHGDGEAIVV